MNTNIDGTTEVPLSVSNLKVYFLTQDGVSKVITRLNFSLRESEILGIFGESGSGKTVVSNSIIDLLMEPGYVVGGSVKINGFNVYRDVKSLAKFEASIASGKKRKIGETLIFPLPLSPKIPRISLSLNKKFSLVITFETPYCVRK